MNELGRIDLHTHSTCSDGSFTPQELVGHAAEVGLSGLAITDHDSIAGYAMAKPVADSLRLLLIPGVEFSAAAPLESVHILGYSYRPEAPSIRDLCLRHAKRREERNLAILARLKRAGMAIEESELDQFALGSIGRPHIALLLMEKGYVHSVQEAFERFLGEGKSCYMAGETISVDETIAAIHLAGGYAVIAHPHLLQRSNTVAYLVRLPFDGIEGYYARMPVTRERQWIELAKAHRWMVTGGSDFHGSCKPTIPLGCSWSPPESARKILERARENGILV